MDSAEHKQSKKEQRKLYKKANAEHIKEVNKAYRDRNKEQIKASSKVYVEKNRESVLARRAEYRAKNKELLNEKGKQYYLQHSDHHKAKGKIYQEANKEYLATVGRQRRAECLAAWKPIILSTRSFACEICGLELVYLSVGCGKASNAVHWDHRTGDETIAVAPYRWLAGHLPTPENIALWNQCNFGMLCVNCNVMVGSPKGRRERILRMLAYVQKTKRPTLPCNRLGHSGWL